MEQGRRLRQEVQAWLGRGDPSPPLLPAPTPLRVSRGASS